MNTRDQLASDPPTSVDELPKNVPEYANQLRLDVLQHYRHLKIPDGSQKGKIPLLTKDEIRTMHLCQRRDNLVKEWRAFGHQWPRLMDNFADGNEVKPEAIEPELVPVDSERDTGMLFRFATLLWSVPVSHGYGRRIRYLVRDRSNGKLIGLFALGDPVFSIRCRDEWIGWNVEDRRRRLANVMDAYVVGAVPPYSKLLGGKLVAALIASSEVNDAFTARYGDRTGIISGQAKNARLALVTVTSALGRSSLYNRLKLMSQDGTVQTSLADFVRVGSTAGYGHFQLSEDLFRRVRTLLSDMGHRYANGHQFGQGPNWRMRVIRVGLETLGIQGDPMFHGVAREVYALPLAENCRQFLRGQDQEPVLDRPSASEIVEAGLARWVVPRAMRSDSYRSVKKAFLAADLESVINGPGT